MDLLSCSWSNENEEEDDQRERWDENERTNCAWKNSKEYFIVCFLFFLLNIRTYTHTHLRTQSVSVYRRKSLLATEQVSFDSEYVFSLLLCSSLALFSHSFSILFVSLSFSLSLYFLLFSGLSRHSTSFVYFFCLILLQFTHTHRLMHGLNVSLRRLVNITFRSFGHTTITTIRNRRETKVSLSFSLSLYSMCLLLVLVYKYILSCACEYIWTNDDDDDGDDDNNATDWNSSNTHSQILTHTHTCHTLIKAYYYAPKLTIYSKLID